MTMDEKLDIKESETEIPLLPIYEEKLASDGAANSAAPPPQSSSSPTPSPQAPDLAAMGIHTPPAPVNNNRTLALVLGTFALLWFTFTATGTFDIYSLGVSSSSSRPCHGDSGVAGATKRLVPLEAHVMSKCPDTQACLKELVLPAMERAHAKVDFKLSFLGRPTSDDGVECMHGPGECLGNILELCAGYLYPVPQSLPFAMCLANDYQLIPDESLVRQCALEHAIDFQRINDCASDDAGGLGIGLLRESVERSIQKGVTKSCTVRLNDQIYCIHDGEWKECPKGPGVNDLVLEIEKLYRSQEF